MENYEIQYAIRVLENAGYIIRKPSEANLPVVLEAVPCPHNIWHLAVRADMMMNGTPFCFQQTFPIELVLNQDDDRFRTQDLPRIMGSELGHYLAERLAENIASQVAEKITPLVPEKRMSLAGIVSFIAEALGTSKHRIEPKLYDENDARIKP